MAEISMDAVIEQLLGVLDEAFAGPPEAWSYFTDNSPDAGLLGTLATLSAAEASRPWGGTTIAAHVNHILFGLAASSAWIRGDRDPRNWQESWRVRAVDDAAWSRMLEELRRAYEDLRQAIQTHSSSSVEAMGEAIGAIAHVGYHLGAIRQKID